MQRMFEDASSFNHNISRWNIWKVQNMRGMFHDATSFNQNLCWNNNSGIIHEEYWSNIFEGTAGGKLLNYPSCLPTIKFRNKASNGKYCMKAEGAWNNALMKTSLCSSPNLLQKFQCGNDGLIYLKKNPSKCIKRAFKYLRVGTCPTYHNNASYQWNISQNNIFYWEQGGYSNVVSIENDEANNVKLLELVPYNNAPKTRRWATPTTKK